MDIILYAVPFFFLLIAIELYVDYRRGTGYYRLNDAITSLALGTLSQMMGVIHLLIPFTFYVWVQSNYALFDVAFTPLNWVLAFIAYDFCYYWKHRFGHEMNIMWAAHVVHHSSEEYNLTTALRQTSGSNIGFIIYLPLALIGIDPVMLVTVGSLNLIYQYWVHTQLIDKLGWMEWIFVTPSNHRGHHAQNTVYIDRNYGGVFIVWDRLFGSYQAELDDDKPIFGIRGAVASWNPVWANLQVFHQLARDCYHTKNWWHKLTIWFRRTGWRPPDVVEKFPISKVEDLSEFKKFDPPVGLSTKLYALVQYVVVVILSLILLSNLDDFSAAQQLAIIAMVVLGSVSTGFVLEGRDWGKRLDLMKYPLMALVFILVSATNAFLYVAVVGAVLSVGLHIFWRDESNPRREQAMEEGTRV